MMFNVGFKNEHGLQRPMSEQFFLTPSNHIKLHLIHTLLEKKAILYLISDTISINDHSIISGLLPQFETGQGLPKGERINGLIIIVLTCLITFQ